MLAACTGSSASGQPRSGTAVGPSDSPSTTCPTPDVGSFTEDADDVSRSLTTAIQRHDMQSFVALGASGAVRSALTTWWRNVTALGYTTGGAGPDFQATVSRTPSCE